MRTGRLIYNVVGWVQPMQGSTSELLELGDPAVEYVKPIVVQALQCHLYMQIASFTTNSMVRLVCCSVLCPDMFSYGRFVNDACVLILLQTCFDSLGLEGPDS